MRQIAARRSLFVVFGGDHSITGPIVRGLAQIGRPIDIVRFDAHHDFRDHLQGVRSMNGGPIRRCAEFPWVRNISQFGIRSPGYPRAGRRAARAAMCS
jgi:agmatinase